MIAGYKAVHVGRSAEIVEKKSKFIATVFSVESEKEAISNIEAMRKKYWDATHNCYAYTIGLNDEITRCSDDREPAQTAGKPILEVILREGVHNVLVVVTRYFGGTLLGTGGLVRAYSKAAKEGLISSDIVDMIKGKKLRITTDYNLIGKIQYIVATLNITSLDVIYTDKVEMLVVVSDEIVDSFTKKINEATSAKAIVSEEEEGYFAILDGKVIGI